jgi:hypothetical protein
MQNNQKQRRHRDRERWVEIQTDGEETERQGNGETDWGKTRQTERWV